MTKRCIGALISMFIVCGAIKYATTVSLAYESKYQDTWIPYSQKQLCLQIGEEENVSPQLLMAIIEAESSGRMTARNTGDGYDCYGICQINGIVHGYDYQTEEQQIRKACEILKSYKNTEIDISYCLDCYNGLSKAHVLYENCTMGEYAQKVLTRAYEIEDAEGLHIDWQKQHG